MLIVLFGLPGAGKNYIGELIKKNYGYYFFDADTLLTPGMNKSIRNGIPVTERQFDGFFRLIIKRAKLLKRRYSNIVLTQSFRQEKHRLLFKKAFPDVRFVLIKAPVDLIEQRLRKRRHVVTPAYAKKIRRLFEKPTVKHDTILNDGVRKKLFRQLDNALSAHRRHG